MTQNTDRDREEFDAWVTSEDIDIDIFSDEYGYVSGVTEIVFMSWQAARRAPVAHKYCDLCKDDGGYYYGRTGYEPCCVDDEPHSTDAFHITGRKNG